jgi:uncharacterized membrane protein
MFSETIHHLLLARTGIENAPVASTSPDWWGVLAGLHPVLTHFPIALIIVAAGVEFVGLIMRREKVASFTVIALLIGGTSAIFSAWSGWSLADAGYGRGWQLELHRWLGVAAGLLGLSLSILVLVAWFGTRVWATSIVRALTFVCAILIGVAAHFGGDLVWGESLVLKSLFPEPGAQPLSVSDHEPLVETEPETTSAPASATESSSETQPTDAPTPEKAVPVSKASEKNEADAPLKVAMVSYSKQIEPILEANCWKCHGATGRARAGLRLVSQADFDRVLDEHPLVSPGAPERSVLFEVVTLPRDDDDAMPPSGPGLSADEIALLELWIEQGGSIASRGSDSGDQPPATAIAPGTPATTDLPPSEVNASTSLTSRGIEEASKALLARGVPVKPVSRDSEFLELNAGSLSHRIDPPFGDADLQSIIPLSTVLVGLDLAHTEVTDPGLDSLVGFNVLRKLNLKGTSVSSESAGVLAALVGLERLNLFETQMDDAGLQRLVGSPSLRKIFVGSSRVTESGVAAARSLNSDVDIILSVSTPADG